MAPVLNICLVLALSVPVGLMLATCVTQQEEHLSAERRPAVSTAAFESLINREMTREQFTHIILTRVRIYDRNGDGLDSLDLESAKNHSFRGVRAYSLASILRNDVDGDGNVTRREVEITARRQRMLPDIGQLDHATAHMIASTIRIVMKADKDGDSTITSDEMRSYDLPRGFGPRGNVVGDMKELIALDPNKDGQLTEDEAKKLAGAIFERYDKDGDGIVGAAEFGAAQRTNEAQRLKVESREHCPLPKPAADDQVIVFGASRGAAVSTASVVGMDDETTTGQVFIEAGTSPLYIVLSSENAMIWQFDGATERVARVLMIPPSSGKSGAGVTGIPSDRIGFLKPRTCLGGHTDVRSKWAGKVRAVITHAIGQPVDVFGAAGRLFVVELPSGRTTADRPPLPGPAPEGTDPRVWRDLAPFYPAGIKDIDPATVVSPDSVQRYDVLPQRAGLLLLIQNGSLVPTGDGKYRIVRPIPRFPSPSRNGPPIRYLLRKDIPLPGGPAYHTCVNSEETGEALTEYSKSRLCRER